MKLPSFLNFYLRKDQIFDRFDTAAARKQETPKIYQD